MASTHGRHGGAVQLFGAVQVFDGQGFHGDSPQIEFNKWFR
jgi:hypothetical protein